MSDFLLVTCFTLVFIEQLWWEPYTNLTIRYTRYQFSPYLLIILAVTEIDIHILFSLWLVLVISFSIG